MRLPLREFDLLANLARVPDRPLSRDALLRAVWRIDFDPGTNRVEVHMSRLRAKVDRGFDWPMLHTVKGRGYALRSRPDQVSLPISSFPFSRAHHYYNSLELAICTLGRGRKWQVWMCEDYPPSSSARTERRRVIEVGRAH